MTGHRLRGKERYGSHRAQDHENRTGGQQAGRPDAEGGRYRLEAKGYLIRQANPKDGRSQLLFATEKAEGLRNSKAQVETTFYEWLLAELPEAEKVAFCKTLDTIYCRSKQESRAGFPHITALTEQGEGERHE